jgi:hypothetical protein
MGSRKGNETNQHEPVAIATHTGETMAVLGELQLK